MLLPVEVRKLKTKAIIELLHLNLGKEKSLKLIQSFKEDREFGLIMRYVRDNDILYCLSNNYSSRLSEKDITQIDYEMVKVLAVPLSEEGVKEFLDAYKNGK